MDLENTINGWLNPNGKLVTDHPKANVDMVAWHNNVGYGIIAELMNFEDYVEAFDWVTNLKFGYDATQYLEDNEWIRLHGFGGLKPRWILPPDKKMTKRQENTIVDWCNANERTWDDAFTR